MLKLIREFLGTLNKSSKTIQTYKNGLNLFMDYMSEVMDSFDILDVTSDTPRDFKLWMIDRGLSVSTQNVYCAAVMSFLREMFDIDKTGELFDFSKAEYRLSKIKSNQEYRAKEIDSRIPFALDYVDRVAAENPSPINLRNRLILWFLYTTGCRISEARSVNVSDIHGDTVIVRGKGEKERPIFIVHDGAIRAMDEYLKSRTDSCDALFVTHGTSEVGRISNTMMVSVIARLSDLSGIQFSAHDFRHFRARKMLDDGAPIEVIQDLLGHSSINTTKMIYAVFSKQKVYEWAKKLAT